MDKETLKQTADRISRKYHGRAVTVAMFVPSGIGKVIVVVHLEEQEIACEHSLYASRALERAELNAVDT